MYLEVVRSENQPSAKCKASVDQDSAEQKAGHFGESFFQGQYHNLANILDILHLLKNIYLRKYNGHFLALCLVH